MNVHFNAYFYGEMTFILVNGQYKMQTADCRLQTGYKMQTADCRLQTEYKMQTDI